MTEVMAGAYHRAHGLDVVGLRYFTVYGPRQRPDMGLAKFIEATAEGRRLSIYGDGRQLRDFTYVGDVVAATIASAERGGPGSIYNIASSDPRPLLEVLDELGRSLGPSSRSNSRPPSWAMCGTPGPRRACAQAELGFAPGDEPGRRGRGSGRRGQPPARGLAVRDRWRASSPRSEATTTATRSALTP